MSPESWAEIAIAGDVSEIVHAVRSREWIDVAFVGVASALDGLSPVTDPLAGLGGFGTGWLVEHVRPLSEPLDWLAGDPAGIAAQAWGLRDVAGRLSAEAEELARAVGAEVAGWSGLAEEAYRAWIARRAGELRTLGAAAGTSAAITQEGGGLVGAVRLMIRDAVATVVDRLVASAVELVATGGLGLPATVERVAALCASCAARISRWLQALVGSLRQLLLRSGKLTGLLQIRRDDSHSA